jgi:hypothetical protein
MVIDYGLALVFVSQPSYFDLVRSKLENVLLLVPNPCFQIYLSSECNRFCLTKIDCTAST